MKYDMGTFKSINHGLKALMIKKVPEATLIK
jgi:hypothetical protein